MVYLLRLRYVYLQLADECVLILLQSVLGAIQGIKVASPDITTPTIIGVSCTILILLFAIQPFGITKLGTTFAPIVMVWLLFNFCCGVFNLAKFDYTVLKVSSSVYSAPPLRTFS